MTYANGQLPRSALRRIFHPSYVVYLEAHAAASWNTMCLAVWRARKIRLYPNGANSAYRTYAQQVLMKQIYGSNAATPGSSNHGLGLAVDLASTVMRAALDALGATFGWAKRWSDASWEWWHIKYALGHWSSRPNPGPSVRYPLMRLGSGGPGQQPYVNEIRHHLRRHGIKVHKSGPFTVGVKRAVKRFQRRHHLADTGIVNVATWRKLR